MHTPPRLHGSNEHVLLDDYITPDVARGLLADRVERRLLWGLFRHARHTPLQHTVAVPWSDHQHATPLRDCTDGAIRFFGTSAASAFAFCNMATMAHLMENANPDDAYGMRLLSCVPFASLDQFYAALHTQPAPCPWVVPSVYDQGFVDDDRCFQSYLPDGTVLLFCLDRAEAAVLHVLEPPAPVLGP